MDTEKNDFDMYVVNSILANNNFGIKEVLDIKSIKSMYFNQDVYSSVKKLIAEGNIGGIEKLPMSKERDTEYLDIMLFRDQVGKTYFVTVYDSNDLWQDPQVIEIFPYINEGI
jgi:hypothetical protein